MDNSLYAFRHSLLLLNHGYDQTLRPPFFGKFNIWVHELWAFGSSYSVFSLQNETFRVLSRDELRSFLLRKKWFDVALKPRSFQGRLRLMFSIKDNNDSPAVSMHLPDFEFVERELKLHPTTPQYLQRTMKSSRFWGPGKSSFSILLAFPPFPPTRFSHISLSYNVQSKCTNALITELKDVRDKLKVLHFEQMLDTCQEFWSHPLLVPILLLDLLMSTLETEILENISSMTKLENKIRELPSLGMDNKPLAQREPVTKILSDLHDTLKTAIKLLDAANWVEKTAVMLDEIGKELSQVIHRPSIRLQWVELQGFLEDLRKLTTHLQPDPAMTQQRCLSQIDILNNKMAQEDNLLAARMAVSATRDSSAMKALAVITALFLPGTYIATLFSMSMFNWQGGSSSSSPSHSEVVMPYIWIYWVISFILTFVVMVGWRVWWVTQDRKFRTALPTAVRVTSSGEKVYAPSLEKEVLPRTFVEDLVGLNLHLNLHRRRKLYELP